MKVLKWERDNLREISDHLLSGRVAVLLTDTLYGLVAIARDEKAVKTVYQLKSRNPDKKCIVLIGSIDNLKMFDIVISDTVRKELNKYWPGKVSIELPCASEKMKYLRRGTASLSFRFPDDKQLCELLKLTGPLIAPSANPEGLEPAVNIRMAQKYFADDEILFVDGGEKNSSPSTIISLLESEVRIIRGGPNWRQ